MTIEAQKRWHNAYWIATAIFFSFSAPRIAYFMGAYSSPDWFSQLVAWLVGILIEMPIYAACMAIARLLRPPHSWKKTWTAFFLFIILFCCALYSWHAGNDYTAHFKNKALLSGTENVFLSAYDTEFASAIPFFIILLSLIEPILFGSMEPKKKRAMTDEEFEEEKKRHQQNSELAEIHNQRTQEGIEGRVGAVVLGVAGGFKKLQKSPRQDKVRGKSLEKIEENQDSSQVEEKRIEEGLGKVETISLADSSTKVEELTLPLLETGITVEEEEKGASPHEDLLMQEGVEASPMTRITGPLVMNQEIHVEDQEEAFQESRDECCTDEIALPENTAKRKSVSIPTLVPLMEAPVGFSTRKPYFTDGDGVEWTSLNYAAKHVFEGLVSEQKIRTALATTKISHTHFKVVQTGNGGILVISTTEKSKKEVLKALKIKKAVV